MMVMMGTMDRKVVIMMTRIKKIIHSVNGYTFTMYVLHTKVLLCAVHVQVHNDV
jgi:hypothetical protein